MKGAASTTSRRGNGALETIAAHHDRGALLTREYQTIFKNNGKPMVIVEADATIFLANAEFERLSGYTKKEIEGKKNWMEFVVREDRRRVKEYHRLRASDPMLTPRCFEFRFIDRQGLVRNVVLTIGEIPGTHRSMASLQDITERRRAEREQRASEERYKIIFGNSHDALYVTAPDGDYVDANPAALALFGYTQEEMRRVNVRQLYAVPADAQRYQKEMKEKGFVRDFAAPLRKKDGTIVDCLLTITTWQAADGGAPEYQGIIRDITERKRIEQELRESKENYQSVIDNINRGITLIDSDHNIIATNAPVGAKLNKPVSEVVGKKCFREFEKRDTVCPNCPGVRAMATGQPAEFESEAVRDDQSRFYTRVNAFPVFGHDKKVTGFIEIIEDISDRKTIEEELRQSEERFRRVVETMRVGLSAVDANGIITYVNDQMCQMLGYTTDEMIGRSTIDFHDEESQKLQAEVFAKRKKGVKDSTEYEITWVAKDGHKVNTIVTPTPGFSVDGHYAGSFAILTDITERKRAETELKRYRERLEELVKERTAALQATNEQLQKEIAERKQIAGQLRQSEERFRRLVETMGVGLSAVDANAVITYVNDQMCQMLGYAIDEIIGRPTVDFYDEESKKRQDEMFAKRRKGLKDPTPYEVTWVAKDGHKVNTIVTPTPGFNPVGEFTGSFAIFTDITERKQMVSALQASEEHFKMLADSAPFGISIMSPDKGFEYFNPRFIDIFGYTREDLPDKDSWLVKAYPDEAYRNKVAELWKRDRAEAVKIGEENPRVFTVRCKNGEDKIIDFRTVYLKDGRQYLTYVDITENKKMMEQLRQSEERFRKLVETMRVGLSAVDANGIITYVNDQMCQMLGYTSEEFIGRQTTDFYDEESCTRQEEMFAKRRKGVKDLTPYEITWIAKDGHKVITILTPTPRFSTRDEFIGTFAIFTDITERKKMEEELQQSEERFRRLVETMRVGLTTVDADATITYVNDQMCQMLGYTTEELIGHRTTDFQDEESRKQQEEIFAKRRKGRQEFTPHEVTWVAKDGHRVNTILTPHPHFSIRGHYIGGDGIFTDITEFKKMGEELRQSEERFRRLVETMRVGLSAVDANGVITYVNDQMCQMLGYTMDEMISHPNIDFLDEGSRKQQEEMFLRRREGLKDSTSYEVTWIAKDGHRVNTIITPTPHFSIEGHFVGSFAISTDITERKLMEEQVRHNQEVLQALMDAAPIGISWGDTHGNILYVNRKFQELFGYAVEDIPNTTTWRERAYPDPGYREQIPSLVSLIAEARKQGKETASIIEVIITCKDGSKRNVLQAGTFTTDRTLVMYTDITERKIMEEQLQKSEALHRTLIETTKVGVSAINENGVIIYTNDRLSEIWGYPVNEIMGHRVSEFLDEENLKILQEQIVKRKKGDSESYEIAWRRKDGRNVSTILAPTPIFDAEGHFKGSYGFITDISERKQIEERLKRYATELERSNEEVKNFAYIVSHDLRVPLVNLKGYSAELGASLKTLGANFNVVLSRLPEEKKNEVALALHEDIPEALEFITNSVSRMDHFINAVLLLSRLGRRDLKPERLAMDALVKEIVEGMSHQIQEKGITVSIGALPEVTADRTSMEQIMGNILGNAVKYLEQKRPGVIEVTGEVNGSETTFRIRDNGRGIAADDMDKVFAPFRRAGKQDTPGEGMGLAYVQTLVRRHQGRIRCESELGKGTTFTFTIAARQERG